MPSVTIHPPSQLPTSGTGFPMDEITDARIREIVEEELASLRYEHEELTPTTVWQIPHKLGRIPSVSVFVYRDDVLTSTISQVEHNDINSCRVVMATPESGKAYLF